MLFIVLLVAVFASLVVQEFLPPLGWLSGTRILLYPVFMFYGAVALSYPWMLALAFISGLMWDFSTALVIDGQSQPTPGWSVVFFALLCAIAHGLRSQFRKGRWQIYCVLAGLGTALIVAAEFMVITVAREGFIFDNAVWWRIVGSGLIALLISPLVYWSFHYVGLIAGGGSDERKPEKLTFGADGIFKH